MFGTYLWCIQAVEAHTVGIIMLHLNDLSIVNSAVAIQIGEGQSCIVEIILIMVFIAEAAPLHWVPHGLPRYV